MRGRTALSLIALGAIGFTLLAQKVWREYPAFEYNNFPIPPDYQEKTEFAFARLMYPDASFGGGFRRFRGGNLRSGGTFWATGYPRSGPRFLLALRRAAPGSSAPVGKPAQFGK